MTAFARLGLPAGFDLDPAALERAYLLASRAVHPDHHAGGADEAAAVNEAYRTLRDPFRRAEHLLGDAPADPPPQDPAFLLDVMDLRERAEAGDRSAVERELTDRLAGLVADLRRQFAADDRAGVRRTLGAAKTLRSLLREVAAD